MYILLGNKGRRQLELRQKTNNELLSLYEGELAFHHRSARGIHEAKDRAPVSERMLDNALMDAKKQNRKFRGVQSPRDKHNKRFSMSKSPFKAR